MKLIVIEGLDGSGKATQTQLLAQRLAAAGVRAKTVSFPDYEKPWSCLVRMYLDGQFGSRPEDVSAYAASSFFGVDRFASYRTGWKKDYEAGTVILCDRYVGSNAIHQTAKLPREEWDAYLDWLADFEYSKLGLPRPTATVYLKMDPETSKRLLSQRYGGDESKRDIHEKNLRYLLSCQQSAAYVAEKYGWRVVECCDGQNLLSKEQIAQRVDQALAGVLGIGCGSDWTNRDTMG